MSEKPSREELGRWVVDRYDKMKADATDWLNIIDEVAKYVAPQKSDVMRWVSPDLRSISGNLYDDTAVKANDVLAAGSMANMTPINEIWYAGVPPAGLADNEEAVQWYSKCGEIMRQEMARSNFYTESLGVLQDRGWAGTSAMYSELHNGTLWFKHFEAGHFLIDEDDRGVVDTVARCIKFTHRQAEQKFGRNALSSKVREALDDPSGKKWDDTHEYVHMVMPRPSAWRDEKKLDKENKPVADFYVDKDDKWLVSEGGFEEMPIFVTRWEKMRGERYGVSPAMKCMPTIRETNFLSACLSAGIEKAVFPPTAVYDNMEESPDLSPNGLVVLDSNRPDLIPKPLYAGGQVQWGADLLASKQESIRATFFNDMFQVFTDSTKRMATFEAMQLADEKLVLFHPAQARYYGEFIDPLLRRVFALLLRAKRFPEPPAVVFQFAENNNVEPQMAYQSKISLAVQAVQTRSSFQVLNMLAAIAPYDATAVDQFDFVDMARKAARSFNLADSSIRTPEEAQSVADARMQAMQQQNALSMASEAASAAKDAKAAGLNLAVGGGGGQ